MHKIFITVALYFSAIFSFSQTCNLGFEGFENGGGFPPGFTVAGCYTNGTTAPNTATYHAGFNTENDALITPVYNNPSELCFYWRTSGSSPDFNIDIQWSDDGGSVWNTINTMNLIDSSSQTTYRQNCLNLCGITYTTPTNVQFRFIQYNLANRSWYLDDICVSSGGCSITPTELRFTEIPNTCVNINSNFEVEVCATNASGNIDNTYTDNITISKNTGTGTLSGTLTQPAISGCATFTDLQFDIESNYNLNATDGILTDALSSSIEIKTTCPLVDTLTVVTYNLLNFGNTTLGCPNTVSNRIDTLKKILKYINPDVLMVCELYDGTTANQILTSALNVGGETKYAQSNFVVNGSSGVTNLNNMFYYNTDKLALQIQDEIETDLRDVGEYIVYGLDPNLGTHNDTTYIDFYDAHLKAGDPFFDPNDSIRRIEEADSIRKHIDLKPTGRNNIIGGDFNFYTSTEEAYQILCYQGTYPFVDPISSEGDWNNNGAFSAVHSQSTRASGTTELDCGARGGTDDRFDFLLTSSNVISGANRVTYIPGSYSALGNNGTTFNGSINDAGNTSLVPDSILNALYYMSDHLPVVMKVQIEYPNTNLSIDIIENEEKNEDLLAVKKVLIYPNPTKNDITVELLNFKETDEIYSLKIYNLLGEMVLNDSFDKIKNINLSELKRGIYFVDVFTSNKSIHKQKIILR